MNEAGIHLLLRITARATFVLFFFAFTGSALRDLFSSSFASWLARKRDWFLVAMAGSHSVHLAAIIALFELIGWSRLRLVTLLGGGFVYLLIYLLAANALGRMWSGREGFLVGSLKSEAVALYLIWLIFAVAFIPRMVSGWPVYSLFGAAAIVALITRIVCRVRHRRAMAGVA